MEPRAELLGLAAGYGRTETRLEWSVVRTELEQAKQYWLSTARADGRPHVVPLDGVWLDDKWFYGGDESSVHRRTALRHPQVVMHLPDPFRAVMVEGEVRLERTSDDVAARLAQVSSVKYAEYGMPDDPSSYAEMLCLHPQRVMAWTSFPKDATRFTFDSPS